MVERLNVAVIFLSWLIVTAQIPVPEHPFPDQPIKVELASAVAVKVIGVPEAKPTEHIDPQLNSEELLVIVTVPEPVPDLETESVVVAVGGGAGQSVMDKLTVLEVQTSFP